MQPEQHLQVQLSGGFLPVGQALLPARQPVGAEGLQLGPLQPRLDRGQQLGGPIQRPHRLQVKRQIGRPGGPHADRVDGGEGEAEQIVEHDRMQGGAELGQPLGRTMQMPPLIGGADYKYAHVVAGGGGQGRPIVLTDVIPVQIHIVEFVAGDRLLQ